MIQTALEMQPSDKPFLQALAGQAQTAPPFWLMRQAGRYLPEYRELRKKAGDFLSMVYDPKLAAEITLQPLRRFGMDAAVIFSDILVIPQALGQHLEFVEGEGPKLNPIRSENDLLGIGKLLAKDKLDQVYEAIDLTRQKLRQEGFDQTALIGFAGAPWTLACYMVEGQGSRDFQAVKNWAMEVPGVFSGLIDILTKAVSDHLSAQVEAGAEAVQIFDSWAGYLDGADFQRWVTQPTQKIVESFKQKHPQVPVIGFPKGAGPNYLSYAQQTGVDALSLDPNVPLEWAKDVLQPICALQGNLNPEALCDGENLEKETFAILDALSGGPFVFNLGHGVIKETPPEHVEKLAHIIREYRA